ncbi:MAG: undecaprenyl/decaprenyl-phosphate alpha-N-acetylglucosaminyl 1-phosphate transferase [Actinobacteria bacterium]|nr:undecaprenyl/decaprenyl-phosphate alpha-N-acetylglucosaminyl 1-phosphate transferase [Actinomycetota bacterium]
MDFLNALGIAAPGRWGWVAVILTFVIAALAAWWFIPRVRLFSMRVGWADKPNARRLNEEPLPNAGGLAIFASVVLALVIATLLRRIEIQDVQVQVLAILLGGSFLIMAGFIDDQFGLPPVFRLLVQLLSALLLVGVGIRMEISFGGSFATAISVILTVLWIVAITNAINLLDGVDGLAGGVSFITAMSLLAVSAQDQAKAAATLLLAALGGAALGFLRHNFPPSRIIMGDSGAYFFGFVLAASSILGNLKITTLFGLVPTVLLLLLFFLVPVLDTVQVVLHRLFQRKNPLSSPGRDHVHHRLLARGLSQTRTTLILWGVTLLTNLVALVVQGMSATVVITTGIGIVVLLAVIALLRLRALRRGRRADAETPEADVGTPEAGAKTGGQS